jgi:hypothetical protein
MGNASYIQISNNKQKNSMHAFQGVNKLFLALVVDFGPFQVGQEVKGSILQALLILPSLPKIFSPLILAFP